MRVATMLLSMALSLPGAGHAQSSKAARWLAGEAIRTYCQGSGRFEDGGLIETDLTGDGRDDLVIFTGGLVCDSGLPACGAVYCDADFYVREGDLLKHSGGGVLTQCAELVPGTPPGIRLCSRDGTRYVVRWNGAEFAQ
jgi:hypothetical protein